MTELEEINGRLMESPHKHDWFFIGGFVDNIAISSIYRCLECGMFKHTTGLSTGDHLETLIDDTTETYPEYEKVYGGEL